MNHSKELARNIADRMFNQKFTEKSSHRQAIEQFYTPDFEAHDPASGSSMKGLDALQSFDELYRKAFPDLKYTIEDTITEGDKIVLRLRVEGTQLGPLMNLKPSGKRICISMISICRISDNKIAEAWQIWDRLAMMKQLECADALHQVEPQC